MLAPYFIAALMLLSPAGASDSSCDAGDYSTATLLGDLSSAAQQLVASSDLWSGQRLETPPPIETCTGTCAARRSVLEETERHVRLLEERGVGAWYGDGNIFHILSDEEKQAWLEEHTEAGERVPGVDELSRSSCIEWVMEHLEAYYSSIGELETWERIEQVVRSEKLTGTSLARELEAAGWTSIYLNADGSYAGADGEDNEHSYSWSVVQREGTYYGTAVDESIVGWEADPEKLRKIEQQRFFVMVNRGGVHVTAGVDGQISELARSEGPADQVIYQDPLRDIIRLYSEDVHGGGDEGRHRAMYMWGSGLVLLPPTPES